MNILTLEYVLYHVALIAFAVIYAECTVLITPYRELLNSYTCGVIQSVEPYHGRPVLGAMFDPEEPCFFHIVHFQRDVTNLYVYMLKTLGKRLCSDYRVLPMFLTRMRRSWGWDKFHYLLISEFHKTLKRRLKT